MDAQVQAKFEVGGMLLDQPFKIRRLGHFGLYVNDLPGAVKFYTDYLGFYVSDLLDMKGMARPEDMEKLKDVGPTEAVFTRHGTDHHSFVLFPYKARKALDTRGAMFPGVTINQITWQVSSLREVVNSIDWFKSGEVRINRTGRDTPGSNWHVYPFDPEGHLNELYYGIEQVGWTQRSKPRTMYDRGFHDAPALPQISEQEEVLRAEERGVDILSGTRQMDLRDAKYDVGGILLPRPFKITQIGPVRLFVKDMAKELAFYQQKMGLIHTETVTYKGHACHFLRCNADHHVIALYPMALRAELGLSEHSSMLSFGCRVNDYKQLKDAIAFLKDKGVTIRHLPPELFPGMDYTAFAIDPDGHAVQLYSYMEQIGWDGKPRPAAQRRKVDNAKWPERLDPMSDSLMGETYLGPWG
jgi:catechol 2,3-dioxygenase-like lactoylglutathione lyase family enzyme